MPTDQTIHDVACTVCGCVCDDLRLTIAAGHVLETNGACELAKPWFHALGRIETPAVTIAGESAEFEVALDRAADLLSRARSPLIHGLARSSTEGQRAAIALAEQLGATIDTSASLGHAPSIIALQTVGESTCTLGEVKNRADLVIYWGSDPLNSHPRHLERYALEPVGQFVPKGRAGRYLVVVDKVATATSGQADLFLQVEPGRDFEILTVLRALLADVPLDIDAVGGIAVERLRELAERMKRCQFGIVFFGLGFSRQGHRTVEALLRLTTELNAFTRFYARRMRVSGDVAGADSVLAWQTGYPFGVNFALGYPRYNPGEFTAQEMLLRDEIDVAVIVGSQSLRRFSSEALARLQRLPTIFLDGPNTERLFEPTIRFTTALPGVHCAGTAYRMDEVPIPLRAFLSAEYPGDGEVLERLLHRLRSNKMTPTRSVARP